MNDESLVFDLILTRGPASLARRVTVQVPLDGSPVKVGRAPHCHVVLDPRLVFTSQVQCNLYCVCPTGANHSTPARPLLNAPDTPEARPASRPRLFISDLCSSNGTFVNARRVGGTDPVELKDGDAIIFGGMRDVEVGECIPEDAFAGPELIVWRVDGLAAQGARTPHHDGSSVSPYPFEATPLLLPTKAALDDAERALLQTALQSLRTESGPYVTPTPRVRTTGTDLSEVPRGRPSSSPNDVPQALFTAGVGESSPALPRTATKAAYPTADTPSTDAESPSVGRRSGTVAARLPLGDDTAAVHSGLTVLNLLDVPDAFAEPPAAVHYHTARIGRHRLHVDDAALLGTCALQGQPQPENVQIDEAGQDGEDRDADEGQRGQETGTKRTRPSSPAKNKCKHKGTKVSKAAKSEAHPHTPDTSSTEKEKETADAAESCTAPQTLLSLRKAAPFFLSFTATHWRWVMDTPHVSPSEETNALSAAAATFNALLPITSVESVLVCAERAGIAVELKEGRQLPLVDAEVMSGGSENRWLVFLLEASQVMATGTTATRPVTASKGKKSAQKDAHTTTAPPTIADFNFEAWVSSLAEYYSTQKFPQPLYVEAADFDLIYAPPTA